MNNADIQEAWTYHNDTKHSERSVHMNMHGLDWHNQPLAFKIYPSLEPLLLPRETDPTDIPALAAVSGQSPNRDAAAVPQLRDLAHILYFSAGITKLKRHAGGEIYFRAASCTGALYEFELYLVCGDLPDLDAGIYHFGPGDFSMRRLRSGDFRGALVHASAGEESVSHAPVTIVCAGTYWRNSWKYRDRTYRHFGWDNGTMIANMLAISAALGFPAKVVSGFIDPEVNALIDVDPAHEAAFSMVCIGSAEKSIAETRNEIPQLNFPVVALSANEIDYPRLRRIHDASSLHSREDVLQWRGPTPTRSFPSPQSPLVSLQALSESEMPRDSIDRVILRRGSSRRFARQSISFAELSTILAVSTQGIPADFLEPFGVQINDLYLFVNAVEGLNPGAYVFHRDKHALECLREGQFRADARYLGLQQELPGDASADVFFLADLNPILTRFGNRGYRAVQLEAGIIGGKMYLSAYALRLGATGLTFFDDDVTDFFSPHAAGKSTIFLMAIGRGLKS